MSLVRFRSEAPQNADLAHLVERDLAKVEVAGSSPVIRSNKAVWMKRKMMYGSLPQNIFFVFFILRHHSQAVRQRSAKPLFPGSIPGGASNKKQQHPNGCCFLLENLPRGWQSQNRLRPAGRVPRACVVPPRRSKIYIMSSDFIKIRVHSCRCSSFSAKSYAGMPTFRGKV